MGNINDRSFNEKYPGKRIEIHKFLTTELKRLKHLGFPKHHVSNTASMFTKHIINILEEN